VLRWLVVSMEITNYRIGDIVMINQGVILKHLWTMSSAAHTVP
jgi:hypothetical protein